jgi:hypothetical protein
MSVVYGEKECPGLPPSLLPSSLRVGYAKESF